MVSDFSFPVFHNFWSNEMIYYANDANGINKAVSGLESVIDAKVAA